MSSGLGKIKKRQMARIEKEPNFRNKMFALMGVLLLSYIGMKSWHVYIAMGAFEGQVLERSIEGAAK